MNELIQKLVDNNLVVEDAIIISENQTVPIETFKVFFGDKPPTYENLCGSHTFIWGETEYTRTAEELGYLDCFANWHALSIT